MKILKSLFAFDKRQQRGIFVLMGLLLIAIGAYLWTSTRPVPPLQMQDLSIYQGRIDSLKKLETVSKDTIYAFNPNYITDYKGYRLGMGLEEIDRLHRFRESGQFINSKAQFQQVTKVSDQWLDSIGPYFKFPSWVNSSRKQQSSQRTSYTKTIVRTDINQATAEELKKVYGIGPALSKRILEERERVQGFIDRSQISAVYGLTDSTMLQLDKHFYVQLPADFKKLALNTATQDELLRIPYFDDYLVKQLIQQRTLREGFDSWDKVLLTSRFPQEKLALIQLYLTLD
ncbi:helix-hairpin-helix domain-containing protein [Nonlabens xiamenensis]|uniref:helix-hairpin-helix domain-containing protein n=1 Tax=Nonlabens xiamenensis TaxID=2341043 RepID=UPI000F615812|nr:helix-hairpin-helix domain-containing protein [Nonlabens xiamenensis]